MRSWTGRVAPVTAHSEHRDLIRSTSAAVLHRHFGWRVAIPPYAVAAYVAASRIQSERHYLSDVVFGAALGTAVAHTVNRGQRLTVSPVMTRDERAVMFGWMMR